MRRPAFPLVVLLPFLVAAAASAQGFQVPAPPGPAAGAPSAAAPTPAADTPVSIYGRQPTPARKGQLVDGASDFVSTGNLHQDRHILNSLDVTPWPGAKWHLEQAVNDGLPTRRLSCLARDPERRRLFAGTLDRGVIAIDETSQKPLFTLDAPDLLPDPCVHALFFDGKLDLLYVGTGRGLAVVNVGDADPRRVGDFHVADDTLSDIVTAVAGHPAFRSVIAGSVRGIHEISTAGLARRIETPTVEQIGRIHALVGLDDGLYALSDTGVYRTRDGQDFERCEKAGEDRVPPMATDIARRGNETVWGTLSGLARRNGGGRSMITAAGGLPADWVTAVAFERFTRPDDPQPEALEGLWVGTRDKGIVVLLNDGMHTIDRASNTLSDDHVTDILSTPEAVYVATDGGGLNRFVLVRRLGARPMLDLVVDGDLRRLLCHDKKLYVGTKDGLYVFEDLVMTASYTSANNDLPENEVIDLAFDEAGRLWVATPAMGLAYLEPGGTKFKRPPATSPFPANRMTALFNEPGAGLRFAFHPLEKGRVAWKTGQVTQDLELERQAVPDGVNETDFDESEMSASRPTRLWMSPELGFVGLDGRDGLAVFRDGKWRTDPWFVLHPVASMAQIGAGKFAFGLARGIAYWDDGEIRYRDMVGDQNLYHVDAVCADPDIPNAVFVGNNSRIGDNMRGKFRGFLHHLNNIPGQESTFKFVNWVVDIALDKPYLYIAVESAILVVMLEDVTPVQLERARAAVKAAEARLLAKGKTPKKPEREIDGEPAAPVKRRSPGAAPK